MRLFFDIGNTRLKWALDNGGVFEHSGGVAHQSFDLSELEACLNQEGEVQSVWASSVAASDLQKQLESWVNRFLGQQVNWVAVDAVRSGVRNCYEDLAKLGVDRWMAVLGASQFRKTSGDENSPVIVIDAGTAVTVELLDIDNHYRGGVILPGLVLMHDSLVGRTQGIDSVMVDVVGVIGQNTQQCVNSGVRNGLLGAIERVIREICELLGCVESDVLLLLTGGDAGFVNENSNLEFIVLPHLVLNGLVSFADDGGKS